MGMLDFYLNFLELSGPRQACNGNAITLTLTTWYPLGHARPAMVLLYLYLNFLEASGPCQTCNGDTIPLP